MLEHVDVDVNYIYVQLSAPGKMFLSHDCFCPPHQAGHILLHGEKTTDHKTVNSVPWCMLIPAYKLLVEGLHSAVGLRIFTV